MNSGDTAWVLIATGLVLMMTLPGLMLFYGGAVRSKNVLSVAMQCFAITGLVTVLWVLYGYSLAFSGTGLLLGDIARLGLQGIRADGLSGTLPEPLFVLFQGTFAIITCALIVGAITERARFSALLVFVSLWFTLVYLPVCHWVWGDGGWLGQLGMLDFAGGTVVHINAGVAALVYCIAIGPRSGYPQTPMRPNNLNYTLIGAALLWVGWFGFNGGSSLAADGTAAMGILVTQIAAAAAALSWMGCEWLCHGKPTAFGIASGAIAGLVAITPACGFVGPMGALCIGIVAAGSCYWVSVVLKRRLGYDDSLDVFGVHAVGGAVGALLSGVFAAPFLGGTGFGEGISGIGGQVLVQATGVTAIILYGALLGSLCLWLTTRLCGGLRVTAEQEIEGLDIVLHDERGYNL